MNILNNQIGFLSKVLGLSAVVSIIIKYGGQAVEITPTTFNAIVGISIPPLLMIFALVWRLGNQSSIDL